MENKKIEGFVDKLFSIQMVQVNTIFYSESNFRYQNYINVPIDRKQCEILPSFLIYKEKMSE